MKIRKKITLVYSLIVGFILVFSSLYIYSLSKKYSDQLFYTRLKERAFVAANIYFEKDELSPKLYEHIQKEFLHSLNHEGIVIYDHSNDLLTKDEKPIVDVPITIIDQIRQERYLQFRDGDRQSVGIFYQDNQGDFVIITSAIDDMGIEKINHLKKVLILNFFLTIVVVIVTGRIIANQLLLPMKEMVDQVNRIRATNLHLRLTENESKDELSELGTTFNQMLLRLEKAFESQKQFIHYASHELKTPLTSIMGKVEVVLNRSRSEEEYRKALNVILMEAERLNKLTNGLLSLSKVNYDEDKILFAKIKVDQLLASVIKDLQTHVPDSKIRLFYASDLPESYFLNGNESMLYSAFYNIIENAIKFSGKEEVCVCLEKKGGELLVQISDKGIGINPEDFENVFKPFYRQQNALSYPGSGLGLSIAERIVKQHRGKIDITSNPGTGSVFEIRFLI